jgi:hypothetical protein
VAAGGRTQHELDEEIVRMVGDRMVRRLGLEPGGRLGVELGDS